MAPTLYAVEFGNIGGKPANPDPDNPRTQSIFIINAASGETVSDAVQVVNYTGETKTLLVYPVDSIVSSGGVFGCAQLVDEKKGVGSWVQMSKTEVTLPAGGEELVPFTVTPTANADVGENDGCIVIQEKNADPQSLEGENSSIALSFRTAIRLAVFLPGEIKKSVQILGYAASLGEDGDYVLKPRVKNSGNVSLDVTLNTYTKPFFGFGTENYKQESPLLRNVTSDWNIPFKRPFWGGLYSSVFTVSYDSNVSNSLGDSENQNIVTLQSKRILFFIFPTLLALILELLILAVLGYLAWRLYKNLIGKKNRSKNWKTIVISSQTDIETIARIYGISWKELAKANRLRPPYLLRQGESLRVPSRQHSEAPKQKSILPKLPRKQSVTDWHEITINHPVDIEKIANSYGISWEKLAKQNNLKPPYILRPGDRIKVPGTNTTPSSQSSQAQGMKPREQAARSLQAPSRNLIERIPYFENRRLSREWEEITLSSPIDSIVSTPLDIESIAKSYGVPWKTMAKINKLKPPYILKPGDKIKVPPKKQKF